MSDVVLVALISASGVVAAAWLGSRANKQTRSVVEDVKSAVEVVHHDTVEVNAAVNHKDHGMPTLVQRVTDQDERSVTLAADLAADREWVVSSLRVIADRLKVELPPEPDPVVAPVVQLPSDKAT